ncbi:MAG: DUF2956 domain-containing protein [Gammaproteobacteria bacterium]|nr:DUF2956 domain-containing protein [Gammaproteobacteria bacterium]
MGHYQKSQEISPETRDEALAVANATQRPGQTREQTRLIAQGIEKGIAQYKKQQKVKARELDKRLKSVRQQAQRGNSENDEHDSEAQPQVIYKFARLPWMLLLLSWLGGGVVIYLLL